MGKNDTCGDPATSPDDKSEDLEKNWNDIQLMHILLDPLDDLDEAIEGHTD